MKLIYLSIFIFSVFCSCKKESSNIKNEVIHKDSLDFRLKNDYFPMDSTRSYFYNFYSIHEKDCEICTDIIENKNIVVRFGNSQSVDNLKAFKFDNFYFISIKDSIILITDSLKINDKNSHLTILYSNKSDSTWSNEVNYKGDKTKVKVIQRFDKVKAEFTISIFSFNSLELKFKKDSGLVYKYQGIANGYSKMKLDKIITGKITSIIPVNIDYEIGLNDSFHLDLISNKTTGYSWKWINKKTSSIVDTFNYKYIVDDINKVGSGGKEIWNFKGLKIGFDTIKLEYNQSWNINSKLYSKEIIVKVK